MYKKVVANGYILGLGIVENGGNISEGEYNRLTLVFEAMPTAPEGYYYFLRESDEEWELFKIPEPTDEPTVEDKAEAYDILMGVVE